MDMGNLGAGGGFWDAGAVGRVRGEWAGYLFPSI